MQTTYLTCKNCNANLEIKDKIAFCPYCGSKLMIDDGNRTRTYIRRDEAQIRESERKELIRLKELEYREKQRQREHNEKKWAIIIWLLIMAVCLIMALVLE